MLTQILWWGGILLELLLLLRGIQTNWVRRFPIFYSYHVFILVQSLGLFGVYFWFSALYRGTYWTCEFIALLMGSLILLEIYRVALRRYPGTARMARNLLGFVLAMAVANAVLDVIANKDFLHDVQMKSARLKQKLAELRDRFSSVIAEVRGEGLLIGIRMIPPASAMVDELRVEKMLCPTAGDNVVRLLPPLIIGEEEITESVARIERACIRLAQKQAGARAAS